MRSARLLACFVCSGALACTDGSSTLGDGPSDEDAGEALDAGGLDGAEPDAGEPNPELCPAGRATVKVELVDRFFSHAGVTEAPREAQVEIAAVFEDGAGWDEIVGVSRTPGDFALPCVPEGPYWLVERTSGIRERYRRTSARRVRDVDPKLGRAGAVPAGPGSALSYELEGLSAFEAQDQLELWTTHEVRVLPTPASGAEQARGEVSLPSEIDWQPGLHIDAARGDRLRIVQHRALVGIHGTVQRLVRASDPLAVSTREGAVTPVQTVLREVPVREVPVDVHLADFAASLGGPDPDLVLFVSVHALPADASAAVTGQHGRALAEVTPRGGLERLVADLEVPVLEPASRLVLAVSAVLPLAPGGLRFVNVYVAEIPQTSSGPLVVRPSLAGPSGLRVDGRPAGGRVEGVAPTPRLAWAVSPVPGSTYVLELVDPEFRRVLQYELETPEVTLPPGWPSPAYVDVDTLRAGPGFGLERASGRFGTIAR